MGHDHLDAPVARHADTGDVPRRVLEIRVVAGTVDPHVDRERAITGTARYARDVLAPCGPPVPGSHLTAVPQVAAVRGPVRKAVRVQLRVALEVAVEPK